MNPRHWRKTTWVLHVWNLIFGVAIVSAIANRASGCPKGDQTCSGLSSVGAGIAVVTFVVIWFVGFLVLLFVWDMTRPSGRICPHCGWEVKKRRTTCKQCGYDFTLGGRPARSGASEAWRLARILLRFAVVGFLAWVIARALSHGGVWYLLVIPVAPIALFELVFGSAILWSWAEEFRHAEADDPNVVSGPEPRVMRARTICLSALLVTLTVVAGCGGGGGGSSLYDASRTNLCLSGHQVRTSVSRKVYGAFGEWEQFLTTYFAGGRQTLIIFYPSHSDADPGPPYVYNHVRTEVARNVQWNWTNPAPRRDDALIRACLK